MKWDNRAISGMKSIVFWRPIEMEGPLQHRPLTVCDAQTVKVDDVFPLELAGFAPNPNRRPSQHCLRYNPNHKWYYFPAMTKDEVLMFTQFESFKGVDNTLPDAEFKTCFHCAFEDPSVDEESVEKRKSCEHRVQVYFKNKDYV